MTVYRRGVGLLIMVAAFSGCASFHRLSPMAAQEQFDRADALVSTGCYACLAEAVQLYRREPSGSPRNERAIRQRQLALTLMAFRERELALPNSGADRAVTAIPWASPLPLDVFAMVLRRLEDRDKPIDTDAPAPTEVTTALTQLLAKPATKSVAVAYALALTCPTRASRDVPASSEWLVQMRQIHLSVRYAELTCSTSVAADETSAFIRKEPRFAEVHYQSGLAALYHGQLVSAHEHFELARKGLPHSAVVTLSLANTSLALSKFEEALHLFSVPNSLTGQPSALLGQAKALTYLGRHVEAVTILNTLLEHGAPNPGDNYYWRAWNLYSLSENQAAHKDALEALNFWPSSQVARLAGLTARALTQYDEARSHFVQAIAFEPGDCESRSYLAQLDARANIWNTALAGFDASTSCFKQAIEDQERQLQAGVTGNSPANEILRLQGWHASSLYSAAIVAKLIGQRELALTYARRLVGDPKLGGLARDFILDIDVPATQNHPSIGSDGDYVSVERSADTNGHQPTSQTASASFQASPSRDLAIQLAPAAVAIDHTRRGVFLPFEIVGNLPDDSQVDYTASVLDESGKTLSETSGRRRSRDGRAIGDVKLTLASNTAHVRFIARVVALGLSGTSFATVTVPSEALQTPAHAGGSSLSSRLPEREFVIS